jgi:hypothetical protein
MRDEITPWFGDHALMVSRARDRSLRGIPVAENLSAVVLVDFVC